MMRKLHIRFSPPRRSALRWGGWLLLVCATSLAGFEGYVCFQASRAYEALQFERGRVQAQFNGLEERTTVRAEKVIPGETMRRVANAFDSIHAPWPQVFDGVESALDDTTALLALEPDLARREVRLRIEAKNTEAMLQSLQRIAAAPGLSQVYLETHQVQVQDPQRPVRYTVLARWAGNANSSTGASP